MTGDIDASLTTGPPPARSNRTTRLLGNTGWLLLSTLVGAASSLLLVPYTLSTLGATQFGLWSVVGGVVALFAALDLGLGAATSRSVAFFAASRRWDEVRQVNTVALAVYTAISLVLGLLLALTQDVLVDPGWLSYPARLEHEAHLVLWFAFATFVLLLLTSIPRSLLLGLERIRVVALADLLAQAVNVVILVVMLRRGDGIYALAVSSLLRPVVQGAVLFPLAHRAAHGSLSTTSDPQTRRSLLGFSGWLQLNNICALITLQTDRVVIGYGISVADVTPYELANKISSVVRLVPLQLLNALLPATTAQVARGDHAGLRRTYVDGSRLLALITFGVSGFVAAASGPLVTTWLGHPNARAALLLVLLIGAYAVNALTGLGTTVLRAQGRPRYETYFAVGQTALNILLTVVLVGPYGMVGVVLGTVVSLVVVSLAFVGWFHRTEQLPLWRTFGNWLARLLGSVTAAAVPVVAASFLLPSSVFAHRLTGLAVEAAAFGVYLVVLAVSLRATGFLSRKDLDRVRALRRGAALTD